MNLTYNIHQQLLASLSDAPEGHVDVLLAWQAVHAIIQGVWHRFGHLKYSTTPSQWVAISHCNNLLHKVPDDDTEEKKNISNANDAHGTVQ